MDELKNPTIGYRTSLKKSDNYNGLADFNLFSQDHRIITTMSYQIYSMSFRDQWFHIDQTHKTCVYNRATQARRR